MTPLFLHLPHDSTVIPSAERADFVVSEEALRHELLRLTDWHTADLYADGADPADVVRAEVSRLVVDVERFADDDEERCSAVGMGATYVKTCAGKPLRALSSDRRAELLDCYYWPHHRRLDESAAERLGRFGRCVILDAHSFPTGPLPTQVDFSAPPEIGIGTQPGHTSPELRAVAESFFRRRGFVVGVDVPFSGAIVPNRFCGKNHAVQSVMIEVRRDLYMDERSGERHAGFMRIRSVLTDFRSELARFAAT
jgi:N-formylglutamate amidohydrolase